MLEMPTSELLSFCSRGPSDSFMPLVGKSYTTRNFQINWEMSKCGIRADSLRSQILEATTTSCPLPPWNQWCCKSQSLTSQGTCYQLIPEESRWATVPKGPDPSLFSFPSQPSTSPPEDSESQKPKDELIPGRCEAGELLLEHMPEPRLGSLRRGGPSRGPHCACEFVN